MISVLLYANKSIVSSREQNTTLISTSASISSRFPTSALSSHIQAESHLHITLRAAVNLIPNHRGKRAWPLARRRYLRYVPFASAAEHFCRTGIENTIVYVTHSISSPRLDSLCSGNAVDIAVALQFGPMLLFFFLLCDMPLFGYVCPAL